MNDAPTAVRKNYETIQEAERDGRDDKEIAGHGRTHVIPEERRPGLRGIRRANELRVFGNSGGRDVVAKKLYLRVNARCTPKRILAGEPSDPV